MDVLISRPRYRSDMVLGVMMGAEFGYLRGCAASLFTTDDEPESDEGREVELLSSPSISMMASPLPEVIVSPEASEFVGEGGISDPPPFSSTNVSPVMVRGGAILEGRAREVE
jgi:hypothetical protein